MSQHLLGHAQVTQPKLRSAACTEPVNPRAPGARERAPALRPRDRRCCVWPSHLKVERSEVGLWSDFVPLELSHRDLLQPLLARYPHSLSGYTFASLFTWERVFRYEWMMPSPNCVLLAGRVSPEGPRQLLQPVGELSSALQAQLLSQAARLPQPLEICGVEHSFLARYPELTSHFVATAQRDFANYIYAARDLSTLAGHKFTKKRNLIAQARRSYAWTAEPVSQANLEDCRTVFSRCAQEASAAGDSQLKDEAALTMALDYFVRLELSGVLVRVDGEPVGFSLYSRQTPTTAVVMFERALRSYKGLYQVVNQEVAKAIAARGFARINREEDLGDEGLRHAKESYHPEELAPSYTLTLCKG